MLQIKKYALVFGLLLTQLALSITGGILVTSLPKDNKIIAGIEINNVPVGGLSKSQAVEKVRNRQQEALAKDKVTLKFQKKSWNLYYSEMDAVYNYSQEVDKAYSYGRDGNIFTRLFAVFIAKGQGTEISMPLYFNQNKLKGWLKKAAQKIDQPAQNAKIELKNDRIVVVPEKIGREIQFDKTIKKIVEAIKKHKTGGINPIIDEKKPAILADKLKDIKDPLATSVTAFDKTRQNRSDNIKLAAQLLNGDVVMPGAIFSFNDIIGPRLKEKGYKEAPVFDDGQVVSGVGGGVCQVSTTLYNSVLLAGLEVRERFPHTKPVSYIPVGQDAAVADNKLNFKFINNLRYPIGIIAFVDNDKLVIRVFGKQENPGQTVKIVSEDVQIQQPRVQVKEDPNLSKGYSQVIDPGEKGYYAKVYRIWYNNGKQLRKELLSETTYKSTNTIIRVGTGVNSFSANSK